MNKPQSLLIFLLVFLLAAALQASTRRPDSPYDGRREEAVAEAARRDLRLLEATQAGQLAYRSAQHRLQTSIAQIQEAFDLPRAAIEQTHIFQPFHYISFVQNLQHPEARFVRLALIAQERYSLYATTTRSMNNRRVLLLARVHHQGGAVVPVGLLRVRPGPTQGNRVNFHDLVERLAGEGRESWISLQREYGPLRILEW